MAIKKLENELQSQEKKAGTIHKLKTIKRAMN